MWKGLRNDGTEDVGRHIGSWEVDCRQGGSDCHHLYPWGSWFWMVWEESLLQRGKCRVVRCERMARQQERHSGSGAMGSGSALTF